MENLNNSIAVIGAITTIINGIILAYLTWKKARPEIRKADAEADQENVETMNINLEGAKISGQILLDRINELKGEVDDEKEKRKTAEQQCKDQIAALDASRSEDREYFRRRIKDLENESRDYRRWAATLTKQVVEAGKIPAPLTLSMNESDTRITAIRTELEGKTGKNEAVKK